MSNLKTVSLGVLALALVATGAWAQLAQPCNVPAGTPKPAWCGAVCGDRSQGWLEQSRSEVMARNGIVTASQPLAAQAGLRILQQGGNAVDAAVATGAALSVLEPMSVGIAGDMYAIVYSAKDRKLYGIDASGKAASGATLEYFNAHGWKYDPKRPGPGSGMASNGILAVTVTGSLDGYDRLLKRFGTMSLKEVLEPARQYAEEGFPVSERISNDWNIPRIYGTECCTRGDTDPDTMAAWTIGGKKPTPGQIFRNRDLAKTLGILQKEGRDAFYKGEIAKAIVAKSKALGGTMTLDDLASYHADWVDPISTNYHGYDVWELPPSGQGWAVLEELNILEVCTPKVLGTTLAALGPASPAYWHMLVEAKKLAYADLFAYNADPVFAKVPLDKLLSKTYAASLCKYIDPGKASTPAIQGHNEGGTVYLAAADRWGNMVSFVNSNFAGFGSGVTVPGYGFVLHNRGALFSLDPKSPNVIAPHKRPFNTIIAAFVTRDGKPLIGLGLMGGTQQAQGHMQVLVNLLDLGANVQAATDMARFAHDQIDNVLSLETQLYNLVGAKLAAMGHTVRPANGGPMGGYQAIMFLADPSEAAPAANGLGPVNGTYRAGSDHRKDGGAVGW